MINEPILSYRSYLEVNTSEIIQNVKSIQKFIGSNTKMMSVLKADAYGLGIEKVSKLIEPLTDWFGVATLEEAIQIRNQGIEKPILVMGYVPTELISKVIDLNLTLSTISVEYVEKLSLIIPEGKKLDVHLKIDTGMNRIGLYSSIHSIDDYMRQLERIMVLDKINVTGIYTHLVSAGSTDSEEISFTKHQYDIFISLCEVAESRGYDLGIRHICNSYATIHNQDMHLDMVRVGFFIAFGLHFELDNLDLDLELAFKIRARIVNLKTIYAGESVGYDRTYTAQEPIKVATVSFGYADGFRNGQHQNIEVLINGQRARIIGSIAMDYLMVDVTNVKDVKVDDYVTFIGKDGLDIIMPYDFAEETFEAITQIGIRVPKIYI